MQEEPNVIPPQDIHELARGHNILPKEQALGDVTCESARPRKTSFTSSCNDFKLPNSPASSVSSSGSPGMEPTLWEQPVIPQARRGNVPYIGGRRPSMLNSAMTIDTDFEEDELMDSPFQEDEPVPSTAVPISTPARPINNPNAGWPRSMVPNMQEEPVMGYMGPPLRTSFNPLNPLGIRPAAETRNEDMQTESSLLSSGRPTFLHRARSSPALTLHLNQPATPPSHRVEITDDGQTFEGLGMSLPQPEGDQVSSPPTKGPVRRAVARRGSLFVSCLSL